MTVIYKITNPSGKVYIGQTWNFEKRKKDYKWLGSVKKQPALYNSLIKYGFENHKIEVIHQLPEDVSQTILNTYEYLYWELYKNCNIELLNIREPGSRGKLSEATKKILSDQRMGNKNPLFGIKMSEKNVETLRQRWKGKNNPTFGKNMAGENNPSFGSKRTKKHIKIIIKRNSKPVIQYSIEGKKIKKFTSAMEVQRKLKIPQTNISEVCLGKRKTAGNFIWKFLN